MYLNLIANLDKRNPLNFTIIIKVYKAKNSLLESVDKLTIHNVLSLLILKSKKLMQLLLTQNRLMRLYTECTKEDNKSKKKINS